MFLKNIVAVLFLITLTKKCTDAYCVPCPKEGLTLSSFIECTNCSLPKFYDDSTNSCVRYSECRLPTYKNPLPELKALAPLLHEELTKALDAVDPRKIKLPKDVTLSAQALNKRIQEVKRTLPTLLAPIVGNVALQNRDLLEDCKGNTGCVLRGVMKRESNYDLIFPRLKPVLDEVIKILHGVFDDLKDLTKKECKNRGECPIIKGLLKIRDLVPGNLEEVKDLEQINLQINEYLLKDYVKKLEKTHNGIAIRK